MKLKLVRSTLSLILLFSLGTAHAVSNSKAPSERKSGKAVRALRNTSQNSASVSVNRQDATAPARQIKAPASQGYAPQARMAAPWPHPSKSEGCPKRFSGSLFASTAARPAAGVAAHIPGQAYQNSGIN